MRWIIGALMVIVMGCTGSPAAPAPAPPAAGGYELVQLPLSGFEQALGFAVFPEDDSRAVIITQGGRIWQVSLDGGRATVFGDVADLLIEETNDQEEGLLGLAFSPSFQSDNRVYLYYVADEPRRGVLSRFQVVDGSIDRSSEVVLLEVPQPFESHKGGQLTFGPDGYLYIGLGDGGNSGDPQKNGQNMSNLLGSILRLDVSGEGYTVPSDNPFVGVEEVRPEIYAYGLRHPWRFSFDRLTGDLWVGDVGQGKWEEINRIVAGGNYGWNVMEGFECFEPPSNCDTGGLRLPQIVYGHASGGCAVIGGYVYRGAAMPELDGWYVYGDFCSGKVWAVDTTADAPVLLVETGPPIVSFAELPDGELLILAYTGTSYRLQYKE